MTQQEHGVQTVAIDPDGVYVRCFCGWESEVFPAEAEARDDHETNHLQPLRDE